MGISKNHIVNRKGKKPILADIYNPETQQSKPLVIFCHGYKGFKDWGAWHLMAEHISDAGFCFIKFNFSHNGGTLKQPIDFPDLEAFGNNNYTKELDDLNDIINWTENYFINDNSVDETKIYVIGHSRGGGIVTIKAEEDSRISKVISLAGVSDFGKRFPHGEAFQKWKQDGVYYILNGRTKQQMPHFYQFYEDFKQNEERLTIKRAASNLKIPHLIIHGDADTSVSIDEAYTLHNWSLKSQLYIIEGADHVFNTKHPWIGNQLSPELQAVVEQTIKFLA